MLSALTIENVVLIEKLTLNFKQGLSTLTGETGAGKSIILDSLSLVLGARADTGLIRQGADKAIVTAVFAIPSPEFAEEFDIEGDEIIVSRSLSREGKSKASLNDRPVTVEALRRLGAKLVDIHSQFETHALLEPAQHLALLDRALQDDKALQRVKSSWQIWQDYKLQASHLRSELEKAELLKAQWEADYELLNKLNVAAGEENIWLEKRAAAQQAGRKSEAYNEAIQALSGHEDAADKMLNRAWKALSKLSESDDLTRVQVHIDNAITVVREAAGTLEDLSYTMRDTPNIESVDDRLHELREVARRFRCTCDELPVLCDDLATKLSAYSHNAGALEDIIKKEDVARQDFIKAADALSTLRQKRAVKLGAQVNAELPPLKLERAQFQVAVETLDEKDWNENGIDKVYFMAAMNTGQDLSPLHKTASGGELSRLLLAIKMILSGGQPVLIFDEIDQGVGGATAAAIGARLKRLGQDHQVIVVTHSAQVAASANAHYVVQKAVQDDMTRVAVTELPNLEARRDEVARMLSGSTITNEAKAAANKLLEGHAS